MNNYLQNRLRAVAMELGRMHGEELAQAFLDDYYAAKIWQLDQQRGSHMPQLRSGRPDDAQHVRLLAELTHSN